ncbi:hypothetical protein HQ535_08940 [bacterium]|nr:hypothetical protein [bacterium]
MAKAKDLKAEAIQLQKRLDEVIDELRRTRHAGKHDCYTCCLRVRGWCSIPRWLNDNRDGTGLVDDAKDCPGWREGS